MSSYPSHVKNMKRLKKLGFELEDYWEEDDYFESWNYDTLVEILGSVLYELESKGFKFKEGS